MSDGPGVGGGRQSQPNEGGTAMAMTKNRLIIAGLVVVAVLIILPIVLLVSLELV